MNNFKYKGLSVSKQGAFYIFSIFLGKAMEPTLLRFPLAKATNLLVIIK